MGSGWPTRTSVMWILLPLDREGGTPLCTYPTGHGDSELVGNGKSHFPGHVVYCISVTAGEITLTIMLILAFIPLILASPDPPEADSVFIQPTGRTALVFSPTNAVVHFLSQEEDFVEFYGAFTSTLDRIVEFLQQKNVIMRETNSSVIRIPSEGASIVRIVQGPFIDDDGNNHVAGLVLCEPGRSPLILYGLHSYGEYVDQIRRYYRIR
jgi:hypothetical protein